MYELVLVANGIFEGKKGGKVSSIFPRIISILFFYDDFDLVQKQSGDGKAQCMGQQADRKFLSNHRFFRECF
jgi:hypothetical protein